MIRILFLVLMVAAVLFFGKRILNMFYDPNQCPKCKGKGYWRGTRPDEKERCDECFGTGRIQKF